MMSYEPHIPLGIGRKSQFVFQQFFEMGLEESESPFFNPLAKRISRNLALKSSIFSAFLLAISFILSFQPNCNILSQLLLVGVYVIVGIPSLVDAVDDVINKHDVNIDVLMTIAAFASVFIGSGFEGGLLLVLFSVSGALEETVSLRARHALSTIHLMAPKKALIVLENGDLLEKAIQDIEIGTKILVRSGEIVPLDGTILEGASSVSMSHLTGEYIPIRKEAGSDIVSGAKVLEGSLIVQVTHTSGDSTVAKIVYLITQAKDAKPRLASWFDKFSQIYAITIISASVIFAGFFAYYLNIPYLGREGSIYRSLAFLITASPCALILAVPIAYLSALGALARKGIVLKGGVILDALNDCQCVAFDKTGTLTLGELTLLSIDSVHTNISPDYNTALQVAASLERNAVHPVAKACIDKAQNQGLSSLPTSDIRVVPGFGVEGTVEIQGKKLFCFIGDIRQIANRLKEDESKKILDLAFEKKSLGQLVSGLVFRGEVFVLAFEDKLRQGVSSMIANLKDSGKQVVMLTGDHQTSASKIAHLAGITEFYASLSPEDKLNAIETLSKKYGLAMVGDGVNDAPALARATVGISMGKIASGTAQEASDIILLHDNIDILDWLFLKAKMTKKIVRENLFLALSVIFLASIPALFGDIPLWLAVCLHEGGTVFVGLNALRLLKN